MSGLLEETVRWLAQRELPGPAVVMAVSALPVFEIRGGVVVGLLLLGMGWGETLAFGVLGNMVSVTPLLFLVEWLSRRLEGRGWLGRLLVWMFRRAERRRQQVNRWGPLGLFLFVAVPLPGTGAVTGSLVAVLLRMGKGRALAAIGLGVVGSGAITTAVCMGAWAGLRALL